MSRRASVDTGGFTGERNYRNVLHDRALFELLQENRALLRGTLVDVGCGRRPYKHWMDGALDRYIAVDFDPEVEPDVLGDMTDLPLPDASADVLTCIRALSTSRDPWAALREFARVLRSGGHLIVVDTQNWRWDRDDDHFRFTPQGLEVLARQAGLEVIRAAPRGGFFAYLAAKLATYGGEVAARSRITRAIGAPLLRALENVGGWLDRRLPYERDPLQVELVAVKP